MTDLSGSVRKEIPEIPIRAISEALINSFSHRDYTAPESNKIAIYKDRIEIWNPGEFPSNFKPMDFIEKELPSILRNPKIAKILYYNRKIERWGSGLRRIHNECNKYNVTVRFEVMNYGFNVTFYRKGPNYVDTRIDTKVDTKRQHWIMNYLKEKGTIKSKIVQTRFNISREMASRDLNKLIKRGKVKKKGGGNNIWYELS